MGIILGLSAAICWGSADFLARYSTRMIGTYRTLLFMQLFGFVGLGVYLLVSGEFVQLYQHTSWQPWVWALLAALLNIVSSLALYRAFEVGVLSIVSPIGASYGALTTLLALLSGEKITLMRGLGIVAALAGVILAAAALPSKSSEINFSISKPKSTGKLPRGVKWALLAALSFGFTFWVLGFKVTPVLGGVAPVWFVRLTTLWVLPLFALPLHQNLQLPRGRVWWLVAGVGILDTTAFVSNAVGLTTEQVSVVTVLASLFSAVTVLLAGIFLREKLQWSQWLGILTIFVGILLVSL